MDWRTMWKQPSAFLPLTMSGLALATVLVHLVRYGPAPQPDEGASAHIFQLLIAAQVPIVAFFAITSLPRMPRQALLILLLQAAAVIVALAPVFILKW
jgi:hypothetical protein